MVECVSGIVSLDVCGVSFGYIGLCTLGGTLGGFYLVAGYGLPVALATGFAGAIMGFILGVVTLPILAILLALSAVALCFAAFAGACYALFLVSQYMAEAATLNGPLLLA